MTDLQLRLVLAGVALVLGLVAELRADGQSLEGYGVVALALALLVGWL